MNGDQLTELMTDIYKSIELTEFSEKALSERLEKYIDENGKLDAENVIDFTLKESNYYSRTMLFGVLSSLASEGYLKKK